MLRLLQGLLFLALLSGTAMAARSLTTRQTLAKATEIVAQHLLGRQVLSGKHGAIITAVKLPTPLVHSWRETVRNGRVGAPAHKLQLELSLLDGQGQDSGTRQLVALADVEDTMKIEIHPAIGEVVAIDDAREQVEWLVARTLEVDDSGWRTVLVEMEVVSNGRTQRKEVRAGTPHLRLVHADELLFRD